MCATLAGFASPASAFVTAVAFPPNPAVVGQINVPSSLAVHYSGGDAPTTPTLIMLVPSCASPGQRTAPSAMSSQMCCG